MKQRLVKRFGPFALLGLAEILIFFNNPGRFFVADSLNWFAHRYRSLGDFFAGFLQVDAAFWYRPLTQRTVQSVLFPLVELDPVPYRIVGFVLFFACTLAVFWLAESLTQSRRIAWFSVLIFMPHLIHAFTTYDVAFTPELAFTLFYIVSAAFFVRYLRTKNRNALVASVILFVASLFSKEAATALPFGLLAIWFLLPRENRGSGWCLFPHFAILGIYLAFAVGYLHVRQIDVGYILWGNESMSPDYSFGLGTHILHNVGSAFSWAFGIPQGVHGYWAFSSPVQLTFLKVLRALAGLGAIGVFFSGKRNLLLIGVAWFLTALAPALLLVGHFLPYYLFAPLVGLALAGGTVLDWAYRQCSKISARVAIAVTVLLLGGWTWIHARTANVLADSHGLLGGATKTSATAMNDIRALYPTLPDGARLVLFNEDIPSAAGDQMGGVLFQLAQDNPQLRTDYVTEGLSIPPEDLHSGKVLAFKWTDGHLVDITRWVRQWPDLLKGHAREVNYHLGLSTTEVRADGTDAYVVRIPELANAAADVLYALDGKVMEPFGITLDGRGEVKIDVPSGTKRGTYDFVAVRRAGESDWVAVSRSLLVK